MESFNSRDSFDDWWSTKARAMLGTSPEKRMGIRIGMSKLDAMLRGLHPGKLYVVAGRPGAGKTSFGTTITANIMKLKNTPVLYVSTEINETEVMCQIAEAYAGGVPVYPNGRSSTAKEINQLQDALDKITMQEKYLVLQVIFEKRLSMESVSKMMQDTKPDDGRDRVVIIDQASRIKRNDANGRRSYALATEDMLNELETLAEKWSAALVLLTQLNRGAEYQQHPMLSNLKHSGAFEEFAHAVLLLDKANGNGQRAASGLVENGATIYVAKNRHGWAGPVDCMFFGESHTWKEAADGMG